MSVRHVMKLSFPAALKKVCLVGPPSGARVTSPHFGMHHGSLDGPLNPDEALQRLVQLENENGQLRSQLKQLETAVSQRSEQLLRLLEEVNEGIAECELRRQQALGELQGVAIDLAVSVAGAMIHEEISQDRFPIERWVQKAIERLEVQPSIKIQLNPDDLKQLEQTMVELEKSWGLPSQTQIKADTSLPRGSCRVEGGDYGLLTHVDQYLAEIRQCLQEGVEDAQTERRATQTANQGVRRFPDRRETA